MAGVLAGYVLLMQPDEWQTAWETVRYAAGTGAPED